VLYQSATAASVSTLLKYKDKGVKNMYYHLSIPDIIFIDIIAVTLDYMPASLFSRQTALYGFILS
jgi:hypothetical protein